MNYFDGTVPPTPTLCWDIFCRVIDNFGDIGVCWRLAVNLAQRGQHVRLWTDDASALSWMAPTGMAGVEVLTWTDCIDANQVSLGDVLIEAFGCEIAPEFISAYASCMRSTGRKVMWINLEYLSAEKVVERNHKLPSPVIPGYGLTKHFFYPGFTAATGGLLREVDLLARQNQFDRASWLTQQGIHWQGKRLISVFCYEPLVLGEWLEQLATDDHSTCLLVTPGRAALAVKKEISRQYSRNPLWNKRESLSFFYLPKLTQLEFDHLLMACDVNFVRGEDSMVRGLWAGKPMVWQIYPQHDDAHHAKLEAWLDWLQAPPSLRAFHDAWNAIGNNPPNHVSQLPPFEPIQWIRPIDLARQRLLQQDDLANALISFTLNSL